MLAWSLEPPWCLEDLAGGARRLHAGMWRGGLRGLGPGRTGCVLVLGRDVFPKTNSLRVVIGQAVCEKEVDVSERAEAPFEPFEHDMCVCGCCNLLSRYGRACQQSCCGDVVLPLSLIGSEEAVAVVVDQSEANDPSNMTRAGLVVATCSHCILTGI